ncbi:MAG: hypothetical protein CL814_12735 [Confluentimicrobium sp.]|uniref:VPLPA-CTERM sorting domain-containing protein n=1 Tax=Actibacterium sp. TaxID=1872125 RepID=UPI000C421DEE|nr:VPLPA-CTERM sorting domain-containing protein [Actibacterium sp.]MBC57786.1 hypothetical protein [Actibacterium sp.]
MKKLLLLSTLGVLPFAASPAFADCTPDNPSDGASVICTGIDADGFDFDTLDDITLTVRPAATVQNSGEAIKTDDNLTLVNKGTVLSTGDDAVQTDKGLTLVNRGTITSTAKDGVNADDDATVTNLGTIQGADEGVQGADNLTLINRGTISGADEGVTGDDGVTITNRKTGVIEAADDAIQIANGALIRNYGRIANIGTDLSDPQDSIDIDSGTIWNFKTGSILSTLDAAIDFDSGELGGGFIHNYGRISGTIGILVDPANLSSQTVDNYAGGVIEGTSGTAIDLGAGNDVVALRALSTLIGGIDMGDDDDLLALDGTAFGLIAGGSVLDGGLGNDTVSLGDFLFADIDTVGLDEAGVLDLALSNSKGAARMSLFSWENFIFGDGSYAYSAVAALAPAPVPLPAGVVLLGGALAGLGLARRRR